MEALQSEQTNIKTTLDPYKYRPDFPILSEKIHDNSLVYFDNAATTQKPVQVIESINQYYRTSNANVHRAIHGM